MLFLANQWQVALGVVGGFVLVAIIFWQMRRESEESVREMKEAVADAVATRPGSCALSITNTAELPIVVSSFVMLGLSHAEVEYAVALEIDGHPAWLFQPELRWLRRRNIPEAHLVVQVKGASWPVAQLHLDLDYAFSWEDVDEHPPLKWSEDFLPKGKLYSEDVSGLRRFLERAPALIALLQREEVIAGVETRGDLIMFASYLPVEFHADMYGACVPLLQAFIAAANEHNRVG